MSCSQPTLKNDWSAQLLFSSAATEKRLESPRTVEKRYWHSLNGMASKMNEWQKALMEIAALIESREAMRQNCGDAFVAPSGPTSVSAAIRTVVKTKVVGESDGSK